MAERRPTNADALNGTTSGKARSIGAVENGKVAFSAMASSGARGL
ncbi:hypothetical protein [Sphingopyxis sp. YR583]|nr:hypothetical protein [Sphingopyxis sp. YR583]